MNDNKLLESIKKIQQSIREEGIGMGPTNTVGNGTIAGTGVGKDGEPGGKSSVMGKIRRRKLPTRGI